MYTVTVGANVIQNLLKMHSSTKCIIHNSSSSVTLYRNLTISALNLFPSRMAYKDFISNFQKLEICNLGPDSLTGELAAKMKRRWEGVNHEGQWVKRVNAGGCRNYLGTYTHCLFNTVVADITLESLYNTIFLGATWSPVL